MDSKEILEKIKKEEIKFVQFWFSDIHGNLKRVTTPAAQVEPALKEGVWFDGSSIEGFVRVYESDMRLVPDIQTFRIIPWSPSERKTARVFCDVIRADGRPFEGSPRYILKKIMKKAQNLGYIYNVAPEVEFFVLKEENLPHDQAGYFDATGDLGEGFRQQVMLYLKEMEIIPEAGHHEVAPGQHEIDIRYGNALAVADDTITLKHIIQRTAYHQGLKATFIPKLFIKENGSGMHVHQSLFDFHGKNVFFNPEDQYNLSQIAYYFMAGQIAHARALTAVVAPTVTSYKRLKPGYEAPVNICWGQINRAALIRVPQFMGREKSARCEFRVPDPLANPYLAFAVMLAAGLDGIEKKLSLPKPVEENVYRFTEEKLKELGIDVLPTSLNEALRELEKDEILKETLGAHAFQKFLEAKEKEWHSYSQSIQEDPEGKVTKWELERYF